jgi:short-subunit dehydrogenase
MSAERCAQIIVRAMQRQKNEVIITAGGKLLVLMNRLFPSIVDWAMKRYAPAG